jgi:hypothetical protein
MTPNLPAKLQVTNSLLDQMALYSGLERKPIFIPLNALAVNKRRGPYIRKHER